MSAEPSTAQAAPPSPLLSRPGAVAAQGLDVGVAAHYGDPMREGRLLAQGVAVADLSNRSVLTVCGPDRLSWLHSLTTQQLADVAPGASVQSLVLSPKGHIEHDLHLVDDGQCTWITTEPGNGAALAAWLDSMRFMLRVQVANVTGDYAVVGEVVGDCALAANLPGEPLAWVDPWPGPVGDTAIYGPDGGDSAGGARGRRPKGLAPRSQLAQSGQAAPEVSPPQADQVSVAHPGRERPWREVIVRREQLDAFVADRPLAGSEAVAALRVAAWQPRLGAETDHRSIPHELDWLRTAVHLHKGCYRGQETVARVHNLGRPPRRLVFAHLDGSGHVLPTAGAELTHDGRVVGRLTTVARHFEDGPIGLAVVKRSTPVDAVLLAGEVAVAQTPIVGA